MVRAVRDLSVFKLLAMCCAAILLVGQAHASAHTHDEDEHEGGSAAECLLCVVGSQLDDTTAVDINPCVSGPILATLTPAFENLATHLFRADGNARAPPLS